MNLVIVESPTKAKTITKFLDKGYKIESSFGHVRDLPKSELGVDIENNFLPKYIVSVKSRPTIKKLKELAAKADNVILATDEDREGEAIAWHLCQALKLNPDKADRIVFHEITRDALLEALNKPRHLDMKLVDAQQARRILDRLVGYKLSPFLWKKVAKGLSAGRVQSVAVRLIVEREREIKAFVADEYWTIDALLSSQNEKEKEFTARLNRINGKSVDKLAIKNEEESKKILEDLNGAEYKVAKLEKKKAQKNPLPPFTTSTLQQTANRALGFSAKRTMVIAQQLYENGYITYMRTDSLNLAEKFLTDAKNYLENAFGKNYTLDTPRRFKTKAKGAQEAHEAVRPAEANRDPESLKDTLDPSQHRLYRLIWQRAVASQMPPALFDATTIDVEALKTPYQFRASGQVMKFEGYLKIYPEKSEEVELPMVKENEILNLIKLEKEQHFTKPPARYSDAGLVKALETHGIGRPSTYAPTIATIEARNYVNRDENKKLAPTDIAFVVNDLLVAHFPNIVDFKFTAQMENNLDSIAEGEKEWPPVIREFYEPFNANLEIKYNDIKKTDIMPEEKSEELCDKCGAPMIIKTGRYGKFLACSAFPNCKNIKGMNGNGKSMSEAQTEELKKLEEKYKGELCPKCNEPMVVKNGRYGFFLSCSGYPKCKTIKNINGGQTSDIACPSCGQGQIVAKRGKRGMFYACNRYPDCKTAFWSKPTGEKCTKCGSLMIQDKKEGVKCSNKECA